MAEEITLEGTLESIDWSGMGRVINRTNVIELAPDSSYLFVIQLEESADPEKAEMLVHRLKIILCSLLGESRKLEVIAVNGDFSIDSYRFQEAIA